MPFPEEYIWMVVVGFIISFCLAFAVGANDVANSFATSVGAKVLTLRNAFILASIFEVAGSVLLGARVSDTIRKGIIDVNAYNGSEELLMVGNVASLTGASVWLIVATLLKLPVSSTHSIVGSTLGFALVARGAGGISWLQVGLIAASWVLSPLLSGVISILLFLLIRFMVLNKADPLTAGLRLLPAFYGATVVVNAFSIFYKGPEQLYFDRIPLWGTFVISFGLGGVTALCIYFFFIPWQRKQIIDELTKQEAEIGSEKWVGRNGSVEMSKIVDQDQLDIDSASHLQADPDSNVDDVAADEKLTDSKLNVNKAVDTLPLSTAKDVEECDSNNEKIKDSATRGVQDPPEAAKLFSRLQILTAIFGAFAHGGNDVSNAIGPLVAIWLIAIDGEVAQRSPVPIWVLVYGGAGIVFGLWVLGRRVIETMGTDLTQITPSSGFTIEIGSALTVLVASNIGLPISTTHCKVGSVVFVGRLRSRENVDWKVFRNIVMAWLVTLPAAGLVSAGAMYGLQYLVPPLKTM